MRKNKVLENRIKKVIQSRDMIQATLANRVGIKREYLNKIINGHINPTVSLALRISSSLQLPVERLWIFIED